MINAIAFKNHNVFLEESHVTTDCSCILTSLAKICLNSKYRSIIGLEDLIQKDWFLAGHLFNKRLYTSPSFAQHGDETNSTGVSGSMINANMMGSQETQITASSQSAALENSSSSSSASSSSDSVAPTFLVFLDCLFQLLLQFPNEFEYTETYLIWLWDLSLSGLSFTFSYNGVSEWLAYLKSFTSPTDSTPNGLKSNISDLDPTFLHDLFAANNEFWTTRFEANKAILRNQWFEPTANYLVPCDKIYMLKFWSRCYLRWIEKHHAYMINDQPTKGMMSTTSSSKELTTTTPLVEVIRPVRPPPLPPKPVQTSPLSSNNDGSNNQQVELNAGRAGRSGSFMAENGLRLSDESQNSRKSEIIIKSSF